MKRFQYQKRLRFFILSACIGIAISCAHAATKDTARMRLAKAREDLRIAEATEKRIAADYAKIKNSNNASPAVLDDYEIYLNRVQALVKEKRRIVQGMEAVYASKAKPTSKSYYQHPGAPSVPIDDIPEEKDPDQLSVLDKELDDSLAAFDDMLLKEMETIRSKSHKKMTDLAEEAAEAAQRLREKGIDVGSSGDGSGDSENEQENARTGEKDSEQEGQSGKARESGESSRASSQGKMEKSSSSGKQASSGSSQQPAGEEQDDDIVARQLREAAEKETDPELKEKLWKEYEEYKKGTSDR
ncbi:MAG: hypothetical protein QNI95_18210 [Desulfobacterales bacterium]|nr:hypothetical protein [Desulfobacterales bacterium]